MGVSTVAGNVPLSRTTDNTLRLLQWAGRADVPVYAGAERPLVRDRVAADDVHGATGLGTAQLPEAHTSLAGDGVEFLLSTLQARPGEVTLVATGPLTNLAQAEARVPGVLRKARQVVIMGGAVRVPGNITPAAEFNFYADPHAARQVLASAAELVLVGLDATEQVWLEQAALQDCTGPYAAFCQAACEPVIAFESAHYGFAGMHVHDPVALGAALWPQLFRTQLTVGGCGDDRRANRRSGSSGPAHLGKRPRAARAVRNVCDGSGSGAFSRTIHRTRTTELDPILATPKKRQRAPLF